MKSIISDSNLIKGAAIFLLTVPPIEELPDEMVDVASRLRAGTMERSEALAYMEQTKSKQISEWISFNQEIEKELGSWTKI